MCKSGDRLSANTGISPSFLCSNSECGYETVGPGPFRRETRTRSNNSLSGSVARENEPCCRGIFEAIIPKFCSRRTEFGSARSIVKDSLFQSAVDSQSEHAMEQHYRCRVHCRKN